MTDYQVDDDALKRVAEAMRLPAKTLLLAIQKFDRTTKDLGAPWGDDEIGKQWESIYLPGLAKVHTGLRDIAAGLQGMSEKIELMALLYRGTEEANLH